MKQFFPTTKTFTLKGLGREFTKKRREFKMSKKEFSNFLDWDEETTERLEKGECEMEERELTHLCQMLGLCDDLRLK